MMADLMMTYEFGMHDPAEDNPAINGLFTFASFVVFGAVPLVPYFLFEPSERTFGARRSRPIAVDRDHGKAAAHCERNRDAGRGLRCGRLSRRVAGGRLADQAAAVAHILVMLA